MADSKVSELTSASLVGGTDVFYIVQSNTSKKVTAATLFQNAANVVLKGNINYESSVQLLSAPGIIDLTKPITHLSADASGGAIIIPAGTINQQKIIVMISTSGGSYTLTSNVANSDVITFANVGDTATLLFTNNKWFKIGGTASLT